MILFLASFLSTTFAQVRVDKNISRKYYETLKKVPQKLNAIYDRPERSFGLFTVIRTDTINKKDLIESKIKIMGVDSAWNVIPVKIADENTLPYPGKFPLKSFLYKNRFFIYPEMIFYSLPSEIKENNIVTKYCENFSNNNKRIFRLAKSKCVISTKHIKAGKTIYGYVLIKTGPKNEESPLFRNGIVKLYMTMCYYFKTTPTQVKHRPYQLSFP